MKRKLLSNKRFLAWLDRRVEQYLYNCDWSACCGFAHQLSPWFRFEYVNGAVVVEYDEDDTADQDFERDPDYTGEANEVEEKPNGLSVRGQEVRRKATQR